eukprot:GFUD01104109.1.p1 GENE.GFUD01104109.1~~GFUD01104109.1.p1  ORF type:complete len:294 (+),score=106.62 GFUD01104109.1:76-957(+)
MDDKMEELYMPSKWVIRVPVEQAVPLHVKVTIEESKRVRSNVRGRLGVKYGPETGDVVDMFNEECSSKQVVVYLSGGYWQELSGDISAYTVAPLVSAGHCVAVVNYARAPEQDMGGIVGQVERAGAWLVRYAKERGLSVWLAGHSAGSHLCAMLLSSGWYQGLPHQDRNIVRGVIHLSGVFDLLPILSTSVNFPLKMTRLDAEMFSPLQQGNMDRLVTAKHLQHWVVVGENDSPAFKEQAEKYVGELEGRGCQVAFTVQPSEDHFSLVERLMEDQYSLTLQVLAFINTGSVSW